MYLYIFHDKYHVLTFVNSLKLLPNCSPCKYKNTYVLMYVCSYMSTMEEASAATYLLPDKNSMLAELIFALEN